jgi:hypothetical protein
LAAQRDGTEIRDRIAAKLPLDGAATKSELELLPMGAVHEYPGQPQFAGRRIGRERRRDVHH